MQRTQLENSQWLKGELGKAQMEGTLHIFLLVAFYGVHFILNFLV